jgi:hypothetical protein
LRSSWECAVRAQQAKALGLHIDLSYKFHDPGRFGGATGPKLIEGVVKDDRPPRIVLAALIALMLTAKRPSHPRP